MAKSRKRRRYNPRRRRRTARRRRRNPGALVVNPRRRTSRRRYRRRNPASLKGGVDALLSLLFPATLGGVALGFIDSKILGTRGTIIRMGGKLVLALGFTTIGEKWLGRDGSRAAAAGVLATIGQEIGVRLGGGMVAMTKEEGVKALIEAAVEDENVAALIEGNGGGGTDADEIEDAIIAMESRAAQMEELGANGDYEMIASMTR